MKRLHLLALLFLTLLVLDETLGAYHKSNKQEKKKKKSGSESQEAKKRFDDSPKQHKRKTREVSTENEENEGDLEVEEKEAFRPSKETKKRYGKEEAKTEKFNKKKKQSEEEACFAKDKKKSGKKNSDWKKKKSFQDEPSIETDGENVEEPVYITKGKKKSIRKIEPELKQNYNADRTANEEERQGKTGCNAEDDLEVEPESEIDVTRVQSKKASRIKRYIEETMEEEEENEGSELDTVAEEKCYYQ